MAIFGEIWGAQGGATQEGEQTWAVKTLGYHRRRPYRVEYTGSLLTSEVKRRRARLVLGWGTAREDLRVLSAFHIRRLTQHPKVRRFVALCFISYLGF